MQGSRFTILKIGLWPAIPLLLGAVFAVPASKAGWGVAAALMGAVVFAGAINFVFFIRWGKGIRRELRENDGRFCLKCGYNLAQSPMMGHCPECGVAYAIDAVRRGWRAVVGFDDRDLKSDEPASPVREIGDSPRQ